MKFSRSQLSDQMPMMKPNNEKLTTVIMRIAIIIRGYIIFKSTNILAVAKMMHPMIIDFEAAAPT